MKRTNKYTRLFFAGLVSLLICSSCADEVEISRDNPAEGEANVQFTVSLPVGNTATRSSVATRALTPGNESHIDAIHILMFDQSGDQLLRETPGISGTNVSNVEGDINKKSFTIRLKQGDYDMVMFANLPGDIRGTLRDLVGGKKVDVLKALTTEMPSDGKWLADASATGYRPIPMWGDMGNITVAGDMSITSGITLTRMLAKVDVQIAATVTNFTITSVDVYNYNKTGMIAPASTVWNSSATPPRVTAPTLPASPGTTKTPPIEYNNGENEDGETIISNKCANEIYLFEAENHTAGSHTTGREPTDRTCIVVGGRFGTDQNPTYYRADFSTGTGESEVFLDVLRNHHYTFNITKVSQRGEDTSLEAFEGVKKAEFTVTIKNWGDVDQTITDGQFFLTTSFSEHTFSILGGDATLNIETDYNKSNEGFPAGLQIELTGDGSWLTMNESGTDYNKTLSFTANNNFAFESGRTAQLTIKAGNLTKYITIDQGGDLTELAKVTRGQANTYMVNNSSPEVFFIPTSQVVRAMGGMASSNPNRIAGYLCTDFITDYTKLAAAVYWSDINQFGEENNSAVVKSVRYLPMSGDLTDDIIMVSPGKGLGNTSVILYVDADGSDSYTSGDVIAWSWHIWNSSYYPYEADGTPNGKKGSPYEASLSNTNWMDRNIGAMSATAGDIASTGFFYQWGRKDPLPGITTWSGPVGSLFLATGGTISATDGASHGNQTLVNATRNPLTRYVNTTTTDWFTTNISNYNDDLWGEGSNSRTYVNQTTKKSVYDPCPEGYKVPRYTAAEGWGTSSGTSNWLGTFGTSPYMSGQYSDLYGGYYPGAGSLQNTANYNLTGAGAQCRYWMATPATGSTARIHRMQASTVNPTNADNQRFWSASVRCIKE